MSVNRYLPHLFVLPEDDDNRQLANGFCLELLAVQLQVQVQVLPIAGGWLKVLEKFESDHIDGMKQYGLRYMVLVIDFDGQDDRLESARTYIPESLRDRVMIIGARNEPKDLKEALGGSCETLGRRLASDCRDDEEEMWNHEMLIHNKVEIDRLRRAIRPILFSGAL